MLDSLYESNPTALVIISLAIIIVAGFLMSRLTKLLKLPNVTGYIIAGVLIGPYLLNVIPQAILPEFNFLTDIAIALIAFGVGKHINFRLLKKSFGKMLVITMFESILSGLIVFVFMKFVFGLSTILCIILGAIATSTAPTSTLMTIRQYNAKGKFIDSLIQVIAIDNAISLILFNICLSFTQGSSLDFVSVIKPLALNLFVMLLGFGLGFALKKLYTNKFSQDSRLIMTFAILFGLCAICSFLNLSPLLACMTLGATYITAGGDSEIFKVVSSFTPPILLVFFVVSGMKLNLSMLAGVGVVGVVYFLVRILGKMLGSMLGGTITKSSVEVKKYLGMALIPQAGVSIGLAAIAERFLPVGEAGLLTTIILSSAILYELVGPALAKHAIFASDSIPEDSVYKNKKKLTPLEEYLNQHLQDNFMGDFDFLPKNQVKTKNQDPKEKTSQKEQEIQTKKPKENIDSKKEKELDEDKKTDVDN